MNIKEKLRSFISRNMLVSGEQVTIQDDDNIFKLGFVNSLFAMKLLNFVESEFCIHIDNDEMRIENFSTLNNLCALIAKKPTSAI